MNEEDMYLFLGIHGFYVVKTFTGLDLYFKVLNTITQLTEGEVDMSVDLFSGLSEEEKQLLSEVIDRKRKLVESLEKN